MRYISMFSGIEAASVAFGQLGWEAICFAEVEGFPSAVLAHHYPGTLNVGDMTAHDWAQYRGHCDLVVGGPPCQAFSVAGLRQSLSDDRGNLSLQYARAIDAIDPLWCITENVPGWLSTRDNAFGCFLAGLVGADAPLEPTGGRWTDAGVVDGPRRTAAWRILNAQHFGLAQRRRRVFVLSVRGSGNWRCAAALFPVGQSLLRDTPPSREAGERIARPVAAGSPRGSGYRNDADTADSLIAPAISPALKSRDHKGPSSDGDGDGAPLIVHALRADGFDAGEDGTGRGTPLVPIAFGWQNSARQGASASASASVTPTLDKSKTPAIAFSAKDHGADAGEIAPTLRAGGHAKSHANAGVMPAVAFQTRGSNLDVGDVSGTFGSNADRASGSAPMVATSAVRRLTPRECERLQGFPDDYTLVPYRGKPAADGPRYKALGNSMAVPCMQWIGRRIAMVEALTSPRSAAA